MPTEQELKKGFSIGDWEVLPAQGLLRSGQREERPEPLVFEVLLALAAADGDLVTRDQLIDTVWGGRPTSDEPINRCLSQLRGHLGDRTRPYRYIETLTRRGYRLNQPVRLLTRGTEEAAGAVAIERGRKRYGRWLLGGSAAGVLLLIALARSGWLGLDGDRPTADSIRSVAVLPFDNRSTGADEYLVSGFKDELVKTLHQIPGLAVKHGRVGYPDLEVGEIAETLGVDALLFGAVQRDGDALKISYHIVDGDSGMTLSSNNFTGRIEGIFGLQERLAVMVRDDLLGESPQELISASRPSNFMAYDRYMRGVFAFERRTISTHLEDAIELFEETIQLDPQFGPAYLSLATAYALLPDYRDASLGEMHRLAIDTVERGMTVDDSIRDAAYAVFGFVFHKQRKWLEAERAYIQAIHGRVVDSNAFNWYARMLAGVGRREDALRIALTAQRLDPSSAVINGLVAVIYTWLGDAERAEDFYARSKLLGGSGMNHLLGHALLLIRAGSFDEARDLTRVGASMDSDDVGWVDALFAALRNPARRGDGLAAIDDAATAGHVDPRIELIVRTMLDDVDGAMAAAKKLAEPGAYYEIDVLYLPELEPLWQHPDFDALLGRLGVTDYWDAKGCVRVDVSVNCPD